ncbi:MAG: hypothetical protein A2505_06705 [Deltaproteobacteria bacterium RIFOXYD12_FULL_55_16]|nr:MAG: hypothetical protein A2505_06705 [Deltaproteobacteria bacterium RIFOXYD12_FULL_55_16]
MQKGERTFLLIYPRGHGQRKGYVARERENLASEPESLAKLARPLPCQQIDTTGLDSGLGRAYDSCCTQRERLASFFSA